jgi:hypothetical protein
MCIVDITNISDTGAIEEILAQLVHLEEDSFWTDSINKCRKPERMPNMIDTLGPINSKSMTWYYSMTTSIYITQGSFTCTS